MQRSCALPYLMALVTALPLPAWAGVECDSPEYATQAKQNACAELRYREADQRLNAQNKRLLAALPSAERNRLQNEQRVWLSKLESGCTEPLGPKEQAGNMWAMEFFECMAQQTAQRTKTLAEWTAPR